jgi:RNA polymerase sigma factor (sigma-70 family)
MMDQSNLRNDPFDGFKRGEESALERYFMCYNRALYVSVCRIVGREEVAEEIVSEAFVKLWHHRGRINDTDHLCSFLYIVSRNGAIEYFRQAKRKEMIQKGSEEWAEPSFVELKESEIGMTQIVEQLYLNIGRLPPQGKKILILRYFRNKEVRVIARLMHLEEQTVRNHLGRSIRFLRNAMMNP